MTTVLRKQMDKSQYEERTGDVRNQSSLMWWILCSFFAPISIPYICFNIWARFKESQLKNSLPSKVIMLLLKTNVLNV